VNGLAVVWFHLGCVCCQLLQHTTEKHITPHHTTQPNPLLLLLHHTHPQDWSSKHNAAFSYYAYYIYANLYMLNKLRESRGLNTFTFRYCPAAADSDMFP
jgi:hypothetical protein